MHAETLFPYLGSLLSSEEQALCRSKAGAFSQNLELLLSLRSGGDAAYRGLIDALAETRDKMGHGLALDALNEAYEQQERGVPVQDLSPGERQSGHL